MPKKMEFFGGSPCLVITIEFVIVHPWMCSRFWDSNENAQKSAFQGVDDHHPLFVRPATLVPTSAAPLTNSVKQKQKQKKPKIRLGQIMPLKLRVFWLEPYPPMRCPRLPHLMGGMPPARMREMKYKDNASRGNSQLAQRKERWGVVW